MALHLRRGGGRHVEEKGLRPEGALARPCRAAHEPLLSGDGAHTQRIDLCATPDLPVEMLARERARLPSAEDPNEKSLMSHTIISPWALAGRPGAPGP